MSSIFFLFGIISSRNHFINFHFSSSFFYIFFPLCFNAIQVAVRLAGIKNCPKNITIAPETAEMLLCWVPFYEASFSREAVEERGQINDDTDGSPSNKTCSIPFFYIREGVVTERWGNGKRFVPLFLEKLFSFVVRLRCGCLFVRNFIQKDCLGYCCGFVSFIISNFKKITWTENYF